LRHPKLSTAKEKLVNYTRKQGTDSEYKIKQSRTAYVPCALTSFFEICDRDDSGNPVKDPVLVGARGGGFIIEKGTRTFARLTSSKKGDRVYLNGRVAKQARTSFNAITLFRRTFDIRESVSVHHYIDPPIGAGFGTSGSGALGTVIALADLFKVRATLKSLSLLAHISDIQSGTGLGTVLSLSSGLAGFGLVTEPGAPGVGRVEQILDDFASYKVICLTLGPMDKSILINSDKRRSKVNKWGRYALKRVLNEPCILSLLSSGRFFAQRIGLNNSYLLKVCTKLVSLGALGATQNMVGNAVHALVPKDETKRFLGKISGITKQGFQLLVTDLAVSGPRVMSN
jgi:pantoate kinase